nr:SOS response-associated peptidase family protein [uncultured Acetatifactor sp.]
MCGRYHIDDDTTKEIEKLIRQAGERLSQETAAALLRIRERDVHPTEEAPVLLAAGGGIGCAWLRWGFPLQQGTEKGLVFNARCESAAEKPLFREGIRHRRSIVPASSFYEWDSGRTKFSFRQEQENALFMAGCCRPYRDGEHFVILTTAANSSMEPVHDRMPLILSREEAICWLLDPGRTDELLRKVPAPLERGTDYEQLRFF